MIELFRSALRPLIHLTATTTQNEIGESITTNTNKKNFSGAIFGTSAKDRQIFADLPTTVTLLTLYTDRHLQPGEQIQDGEKIFDVIGTIEERDLHGKLDHYKIFLRHSQ